MPPCRRTAPARAALAAAAVGLAVALWPRGPAAPEPPALLVQPAPPGELDGRVAAVRRAIERKDALAGELLAGRLGLADAVERLLAAEAEEPEAQAEARRVRAWNYPGLPEREGVARNLVLCAAVHVPDPARREAVADRLAWELDLYLRGHGLAGRNTRPARSLLRPRRASSWAVSAS